MHSSLMIVWKWNVWIRGFSVLKCIDLFSIVSLSESFKDRLIVRNECRKSYSNVGYCFWWKNRSESSKGVTILGGFNVFEFKFLQSKSFLQSYNLTRRVMATKNESTFLYGASNNSSYNGTNSRRSQPESYNTVFFHSIIFYGANIENGHP